LHPLPGSQELATAPTARGVWRADEIERWADRAWWGSKLWRERVTASPIAFAARGVVTVMRYDGPATIRQDEQEVAAECVFTVRPPGDGKGSWYGRFTEGQDRLATGEAVLVLPNGESGRIVIDYLDAFSGAYGTFMGPKRCPQPS